MSSSLPTNRIDLSNVVIHNTIFDISYIEYNRNNIPWKINATYISQNNANINNGDFNSFFGNGTLSNNLIIESSNNDIILATSENNKVRVTNNMEISNNLDVTNTIKANDICLNNVLYLTKETGANIIGNLTIKGSISQLGGDGEVATAGATFTNAILNSSQFIGTNTNRGKITSSDISDSSLNNVEISGSIIYNTLIGRNSDGSIINAIEGAFSDIQLNTLRLNSNLGQVNNSTSIEFTNGSGKSIFITQATDYEKLQITKHLNIGSVVNPVGTSIFNGDISCNTLHYISLDPDICFNNYTDVSFGHFTISGNIIPTIDLCFNLGSSSKKFNNIYSQLFIGDLSGNASTCSLANDLSKNLDMCFNNLTINGITNSNNIIPNVDISSNLGTIDKKWKNAYIQDLSVNNNLDVSGNLKCNTIQIGNSSIGESDFNQGLNDASLNAFIFNDINLTGKLLLDNSKNNYVFFQDISKTLHDNSGGIEIDTSNIDSANNSRTFNVEQNFYYKIEISKQDNYSFGLNEIFFTYTYKDGTLKRYTLKDTNFDSINTTDDDTEIIQNTNYFSTNNFFNDPKYPILFLYNNNVELKKLVIATQNSNLLSINISSTSNNFNIKLFKLYSRPKGLYTMPNTSTTIYTSSYFYYHGSNLNNYGDIIMSDLYYIDNISDNSNNIRIGTGLLNNASNQILIGNYNETFDRSGNNVILGNSYCEAWLPPHGYTTDLGSSDYPFKNCYISENLDVNNINSTNNLFINTASSKNINFTVNNDTKMTIKSDGNVGIGNPGPTSKLHVNGDIRSYNILPSTSNNYSLGNSSFIWNELYVNNIDSTENLNINAASSKYIFFNVNDDKKMIIKSDGNVGIGTTSPTSKLHVEGDIKCNNILPTYSETYSLGTSSNIWNELYVNNINSTENLNINTATSKNIFFNVNNYKKITINSDGNVGIGTTNPTSKLHVEGGIYINGSNNPVNDTYLHCTFESPSGYDNWTIRTSNKNSGNGIEDHSWENKGDLFIVTSTTRASGEYYEGVYIRNVDSTRNLNFTGQHRVIMNINLQEEIGLIVSSSGQYVNIDASTKTNINEALPLCILSNVKKDKRVFGIISNKEDTNITRSYNQGNIEQLGTKKFNNERRFIVNSLGEGSIWVTNTNGSFQNGDYITTSIIPGYGELQDEDTLKNYTVAKITCDCNFSIELQERKTVRRTIKKWLKEKKVWQNVKKEEEKTRNVYNQDLDRWVQQKYTETIDTQEQVYDEYNVYDEEGKIVDTHKVEKVEYLEKEEYEIIYDENGNIILDDELDSSGNIIFEYKYPTRFLKENGEEITYEMYTEMINNKQNVYIACFLGCTYHCG